MEVEGGDDGGVSVEGEPKVKRRMKTPSQLEILEKTYAMETYPSEALRAELSVKVGLSDRQLQMWFCHRRLKDRKDQKIPSEKRQKRSASSSAVAGSSGGIIHETIAENADVAKNSSSGLSLFGSMDLPHQQQRVSHKVGTAVPRISTELPTIRRFYEPPLAISEQRAIKFVEAQLGEPLRVDGPILGMEFDPLPPGAFGAPIVTPEQKKPARRSSDAQLHERLDAKPIKSNLSTGCELNPAYKDTSRALHEYQFLPEKPSVRNDAYERAVPPHYYGSPTDILNARVLLPTGRSILHGNDQVPSGYFQGQMPNSSTLPQQRRQDLHLPPAPAEVGVASPVTPMVNANIDVHHIIHPIAGLDNQITTLDMQIVLDQDRLERKRKTEEARIAKEVEAHERKIRKELEKQDILRRKREEQMKKEMERQDRERRKEEERILREKQREEERYQREQKREMERREKSLQKEYIRAEKMRLKDEMRREKEAARLKAANDRAAARRMAKESIELIEDERLELMELAASSSGSRPIMALDCETLQNLSFLKDKVPEFPPESVHVHLKQPFGIQPWTDSEENVGNLLMVWRFLIAFADVLGLWPFTLDEFIQALHDCDPRLLGEIHIALLRSIIKDIEDVMRSPVSAMVTSQNSAGVHVGGHRHIVEGAYAWGFDWVSWQQHLSPLTWPEVLRQIVLSASFGKNLKERTMKPEYLCDENEGDDSANMISNLRSGVAAENAVAIMQGRGFSNLRRSRHRLTPGTVKFAAFHVLSLEGSKGLPILEVAEKIQRSGLRDLTTSKTPEASISAALSRDTKLFERTAPSTYCVHSPYRKDPANAEVILSAAREKIRVYQNGSVDEEAEDVEREDVEQSQDSESDVADEPDVDELNAVAKLKEANRLEDASQYGKENSCSELMQTPLDARRNSKSSSTLTQSVDEIKSNGTIGATFAGVNTWTAVDDLENTVFDECVSGEPWVQGLTEGEYADLSIEERLNALVALIGVANEGNAIRIALEERLEEANALKKQMWAAAQIDKRRLKDDHISKLHHTSLAGNRAEQKFSHMTVEQRSPLASVYMKNVPSSTSSTNTGFPLVDLNAQQNEEKICNNVITERNPLMQEFSLVSDNMFLQQSIYTAEKSRPELKAFIGYRAEEVYVYRSLPLGQDRRRNRYWQFITSASRNDPGSGRIYVELCNGLWRLIDSEEGFDALLSSLDVRGIRESHLHSMLQRIGSLFKETARKNLLCSDSVQVHDAANKVQQMRQKLEFSSGINSRPKGMDCAPYCSSPGPSVSLPDELGSSGAHRNDIIGKYKDFEWMWKECFDSTVLSALKYGSLKRPQLLEICKCCHILFSWEDNHCPSCHRTYGISENTFNFAEHVTQCKMKWCEEFDGVSLNLSLPPRIRLLKAQLATIEASLLSEALESVWSDEYRKSWCKKLHMASTAEELLQSLTLLEDSIKREFLSSNYETTSEMLSACKVVARYADTFSGAEAVAVLPWIPHTTPAVALRLLELDMSICYSLEQKAAHQKDNEAGYFNKFPSEYFALEGSINVSQTGYRQQDRYLVDLVNRQTILKRGRGRPRGPSRSRGGKSQRRATNSRDGSSNLTIKKDKFTQLPGWKGRSHARGRSKKGCHSIRNRQKPAMRAVGNVVEKRGPKGFVFDDTTSIRQEECKLVMPAVTEDADNISSFENSESGNDNGQASANEYYGNLLVDVFSRKSGQFSASVQYGMDKEDDDHVEYGDEDYNDDEDRDDGMDEEEDYYAEGYANSDYHEEGNQSSDREQARDVGRISVEGSASSSSEYSY